MAHYMQKSMIINFVLLVGFLSLASAFMRMPPTLDMIKNAKAPKDVFAGKKVVPENAPYTEETFDQITDHFNFQDLGAHSTFKMRYLEDKRNWDKGKGPIFLYCGNEGDIVWFYNNSGFLTNDLPREYKAVLVFAEHRYFGKSMPFGQDSFKTDKLVYLTTEQAMADFAYFMRVYKNDILGCPDCPVIAFGGSYGGMLAAWMRMKFPNVIDAAIASSAPITYFKDASNPADFFKVVTLNYKKSKNANCTQTIKDGFNRLDKLIKESSQSDFDKLFKAFNLCTPITHSQNISVLQDWLMNAYSYLAMTNYPYNTSFLQPLPGWPANETCARLNGVNPESKDDDLYEALRESARVYYNWSDTTGSCNEIFQLYAAEQNEPDFFGWVVLACAEMVMPMGSNGITDMYPVRPFDYEGYAKNCKAQFNLETRFDWAMDFFGGRKDSELLGYSNIFFLNGELDPWSAGSPLHSLSSSLPAYFISDSAHHLDLRTPNDKDPSSCKYARNLMRNWLKTWIRKRNLAGRQMAMEL